MQFSKVSGSAAENPWSGSDAPPRQQLWTEDGVAVEMGESKVEPEEESSSQSLKSRTNGLDVSMVSRSFRPNVRRTHWSRFGSEGDSGVSEQNSAVRFLQTLLLTFLAFRRRWVENGGVSPSLVI